MVFTEEIQDEFLVALNEAIIFYHDELINWLTILVNPNEVELNRAVQNLRWRQQELFEELVKVFDELGVPYHYNSENGISYERVEMK